jgi:hypothetical protein
MDIELEDMDMDMEFDVFCGVNNTSCAGTDRTPVAYALTHVALNARASVALKKLRTGRCQKKGAVTTKVPFVPDVTAAPAAPLLEDWGPFLRSVWACWP